MPSSMCIKLSLTTFANASIRQENGNHRTFQTPAVPHPILSHLAAYLLHLVAATTRLLHLWATRLVTAGLTAVGACLLHLKTIPITSRLAVAGAGPS